MGQYMCTKISLSMMGPNMYVHWDKSQYDQTQYVHPEKSQYDWSDPICALRSDSMIRPYTCTKISQYDQTLYVH